MLIHKTMTMPASCLSCWIAPTCEVWVREKSKYKGYDNRLENCPLEEVKRGHWIKDECGASGALGLFVICSECHRNSMGDFPYCPYCGAKMDEVTE